jgi:hypothetical protein
MQAASDASGLVRGASSDGSSKQARALGAAQWKQRVGSGVARTGAKAGDAGARIE